jgi:hypothetical protein
MLWRFLLNLLEDPRNSPCIHWVQRDEGIFRIVNTDWLARLWGRRHGNPRMTYEKMARAMRYGVPSEVKQRDIRGTCVRAVLDLRVSRVYRAASRYIYKGIGYLKAQLRCKHMKLWQNNKIT